MPWEWVFLKLNQFVKSRAVAIKMKTLLWEKNPTPRTPQRLRQQMWKTARQITLVLESLIKGISHHSHSWSKGEKSFKPKSASLTLMLLVANLANTKWCKTPVKWLKPWHMGAHLRVPSKSYPMNTNMTEIRWLKKIVAFLGFGCM